MSIFLPLYLSYIYMCDVCNCLFVHCVRWQSVWLKNTFIPWPWHWIRQLILPRQLNHSGTFPVDLPSTNQDTNHHIIMFLCLYWIGTTIYPEFKFLYIEDGHTFSRANSLLACELISMRTSRYLSSSICRTSIRGVSSDGAMLNPT